MTEETRLKYSLGKRIIKTAISAGVTYFIANKLALNAMSLAVIAAIICMQPTIHETLTVSRNRILASIIGSLVAILFLYIHPQNPLLLTLGIGIMLYICKVFKWKDAGALAGIIFVSIYTSPASSNVFDIALDRLLCTSIGICVSLVINYAIPSNHVYNTIKSDLKKLFIMNVQLLGIALEMVYKNNTDFTEFNLKKLDLVELFNNTNKVRATFKSEVQYMKKAGHSDLEIVEDAIDRFSIVHMYTTQIALDLKVSHLHELSDDFKYMIFQLVGLINSVNEEYEKNDVESFHVTYNEIADDLEKIAVENQGQYSYQENAYIFNLVSNVKQISIEMQPKDTSS